ncbi:hypothetical protein FHL15_004364 [Xylaria flabelliformis]|uniref:Uncharacterized protein n=1 Tax=Xylaria flabelliformis TaxID=2512241 RepID=A0A553I3Z8_9PEZI|nr:hypothetical protein FHL15_004364 [Xylaria flabelliformis]
MHVAYKLCVRFYEKAPRNSMYDSYDTNAALWWNLATIMKSQDRLHSTFGNPENLAACVLVSISGKLHRYLNQSGRASLFQLRPSRNEKLAKRDWASEIDIHGKEAQTDYALAEVVAAMSVLLLLIGYVSRSLAPPCS